MGLDIVTSDYKMDFHIGYSGFTLMRSYFVLGYDESLYEDYVKLTTYIVSCFCFDSEECPIDCDAFDKKVGDLLILIDHSDCEGELTSEECQLLKKVLFIDEDKIKSLERYQNNPERTHFFINKMYEFKRLVNYCADNKDVKLLFG